MFPRGSALGRDGSPLRCRGEDHRAQGRSHGLLLWPWLFLASGGIHAQEAVTLLDDFEDASKWRVVASSQVSGAVRSIEGAAGRALCLDYEFIGVSGDVGIQRDLPLTFPDNYRFSFQVRGDSPDNDLQFKLVDAGGDNAWWVNRPNYDFPGAWTEVRYRKRHIGKAWGPDPDRALRASARLEFAIRNDIGGRGSVCFDNLALETLPPDDESPLEPVSAMSTVPASDAMRVADGDVATAWEAPAGDQRLVLDLGKLREFGGLRLRWLPGRAASRYSILLSGDGAAWRNARDVRGADGGNDWIALPESEARYIALDLHDAERDGYALASLEVQPLAFSAHPDAFVAAVASGSPRGWFPRGFGGGQPRRAILGLDGGLQQGLMGEDGAVEVAQGGFSIEPFVLVDGRLATWNDVQASQSLQDGDLPIPGVHWKRSDLDLRITAFAQGAPRESRLVVRYRLTNPGRTTRDYTLALAVQPFQVSPPGQSPDTSGGVSRIESLSFDGATVSVAGVPRMFSKQIPDAVFATPFDGGMAVAHLAGDEVPATTHVDDPTGLASGASLYRMRLRGWETRSVDVMVPMTGSVALARRWWDAELLQQAVADDWRAKLDRVRMQLPPAAEPVADALRSALAHVLVSRTGSRLQPGARSQARSGIRDGAMLSGLLRMGHEDVVRDYVEREASSPPRDGMVSCCAEGRDSDPLPGNGSHGEWIHGIAEYWRYTGDSAFLERMWPQVAGAFDAMDKLRAGERTEAVRALDPAFYGVMPASMGREDDPARPVHAYRDNFRALRGYKDAVAIAEALGKADDLPRMVAARDQFRDDLYASLQHAMQRHGIDYLPGTAELGDFDPASTALALVSGGEQGRLPDAPLRNTFERYWRDVVARRDDRRERKDDAACEWRNVAAMVRLGWRGRAKEVFDWLFDDRTPHAWYQWGDAESCMPHAPFPGDLPHAWVASEFMRSVLDMFAYPREPDDSIVLAAGIPPEWLEGEGIAIDGLRMPGGRLGYSLRRSGGHLLLEVRKGLELPEGGLVLPWPYEGTPGDAIIDGEPAQWDGRELRITTLPATVRIEMPQHAVP